MRARLQTSRRTLRRVRPPGCVKSSLPCASSSKLRPLSCGGSQYGSLSFFGPVCWRRCRPGRLRILRVGFPPRPYDLRKGFSVRGRFLLRLRALLHPNLLQQAQIILSDLVFGIEAEGSPQMGLGGGVILLRGQDGTQPRFGIGIVGPALDDLLELPRRFGELASEG